MDKKKVVVLGKTDFAMRIADWFLSSPDYELICAVPVIPEPTWTESFMGWAKKSGVPCVESGHYKDISGVQNPEWQVDLAFSVFYDKIIKEWFLAKCRRALNIHNAPLPKYRGVRPINWALKNNERKHGTTIHEMTAGIDDGPIVAHLEYSIYPEFDEVVDVHKRAREYGWILFQQTMPILDKIKPLPQDHSMASYYSKKDIPLLGDRMEDRRERSRQ